MPDIANYLLNPIHVEDVRDKIEHSSECQMKLQPAFFARAAFFDAAGTRCGPFF